MRTLSLTQISSAVNLTRKSDCRCFSRSLLIHSLVRRFSELTPFQLSRSFIKVNEESLLNPASPLTADLVQAAVAIVLRDQMQAAATQSASGDPYSPWGSLSGVMAGTGLTRTIALRSGSDDVLHTISVSQEVGAASGTYVVQGKGWEAVATRVQMNGDDRFSSIIDGRAHTSRVCTPAPLTRISRNVHLNASLLKLGVCNLFI